eukprot:gene7606-8446_t
MVGRGLTPYQGKDRVYGDFQCPQCKHKWSSGNSWADMGQQCSSCKINVYPYAQKKLQPNPYDSDDDDERYDSRKPHREDLCEKCKKIGRNCRNAYP